MLCMPPKSLRVGYTAMGSLMHSSCLHIHKAKQQQIFQPFLTGPRRSERNSLQWSPIQTNTIEWGLGIGPYLGLKCFQKRCIFYVMKITHLSL